MSFGLHNNGCVYDGTSKAAKQYTQWSRGDVVGIGLMRVSSDSHIFFTYAAVNWRLQRNGSHPPGCMFDVYSASYTSRHHGAAVVRNACSTVTALAEMLQYAQL